jgi:hypothetical protein
MFTVTSFHGSDIAPEQLKKIIADYFRLEQRRDVRRHRVKRFGALTVLIVALGPTRVPALALSVAVLLSLLAPAWAWLAELRCAQQLAHGLKRLPPKSAGNLAVHSRLLALVSEKVVKSS